MLSILILSEKKAVAVFAPGLNMVPACLWINRDTNADFEALGDDLQQPVAHGMTKGVVNNLEAVEVQKHDRQFLPPSTCMGNGQL